MYIGIFFLLLGLSVILKAVFHIDIPVFRVVVGLFLISMGVKMVFGCSIGSRLCNLASTNGAVFSQQSFVAGENENGKKEYNVVFGSGTVDLTKLTTPNSEKITVNVVFGEGVVLYDPKQVLQIHSSAVFGNVSTPDGNNNGLGENDTTTGRGVPLQVSVNSVFGSVRFKKKTVVE